MPPSCKAYDIILAYTQFRVHNYYLNIVKHLSQDFSVGIYPVFFEYGGDSATTAAASKVRQTDEMFLGLCKQFGADLLTVGDKYSCQLLLIPQHDYLGVEFDGLQANKTIVLHRFGSGSLGLNQLKKIGAKKLWVYEKAIFLNAIEEEGEKHFQDEFEIIEMGTPYRQYAAVNSLNLEIDYLVACPTVMLLKDSQTNCDLLENMIQLIDSFPDGATICLKLHNVRDGGFWIGNFERFEGMPEKGKLFLDRGLDLTLKAIPELACLGRWKERIANLREGILRERLNNKTIFLSDLTEFYNLGIESFLPYVKQGVVTGISSCIWHALHQRIPVYNCDQRSLQENMPNYAVYKSFYVPSCKGIDFFDDNHFELVSESCRQADLLHLIRKEF